MSVEPLKIFVHSMDGVGHINACVGLAQALAKRGHHIFFLTNDMFSGKFEKYGFKEIVLKSQIKDEQMKNVKESLGDKKPAHPLEGMKQMLKQFRDSGMLSAKKPLEKLQDFDPEKRDFFYKMVEECKQYHQQFKELIEKEKPDLIIVDHFVVSPCITYGNVFWAYLFSGNPSFMHNSEDIPPPMSGYPSNDRTGWDEFRARFKETFQKNFEYHQNLCNRALGYPDVAQDHFLFISPYMNIYGYPKELDYGDIVKIPDHFVQVDAFCRESSETFELPEEFKSKIKPGDKLIYLSMGSMGSIDYDLMKRITSALANSPHKYIVSKGPSHDQYELPDNMWGEAYLPQTKVLPLVDMVITHGGNNTVTESLVFGKPMLVMPLFGDQYDNAQRILEKGYGYRIEPYEFKDEDLIEKIDKILNDKEMNEKVKKMAERMKMDNSKEKACEKIERMVKEFKAKTN